MGCEIKNFTDHPKVRNRMKLADLKHSLAQLTEQLLPFYEDDEDELERQVQKILDDQPGMVGYMSAISWCHGQIGLIKSLCDLQDEG